MMDFAQVIMELRSGKNCYRMKWMGDNSMPSFITMQIPAEIPYDVIPNMTSLNQGVKDILKEKGTVLRYSNQVLGIKMCKGVANATYYIPSWEDIFTADWMTV